MEVSFSDTFSPFLLEDCDGIYTVKNTVTTSENTMTDGSTYQGSTTQMRNIVLTLRDHPKADHQENRSLLYNLFKPKSPGTLVYLENDKAESRSIEYYVESIDIDGANRARQATISLLCPDPFFVAPSDITVTMAGWISYFEFAHEFPPEGEEFEARVEEKLKTIDNTWLNHSDTYNMYLEKVKPSVSKRRMRKIISKHQRRENERRRQCSTKQSRATRRRDRQR